MAAEEGTSLHGKLARSRPAYRGRGAPAPGAPEFEAGPSGSAAVAHPGAGLPLLAAPGVDPGRDARLVVYNGAIHLVVRDVFESLKKLQEIAARLGGYMQELSETAITIKVPADRFAEAVTEAERLGEVTRKSIKGTDVTEEMRDLKIRLKNAEDVRARLARLLDRADTVEEALKIEKELARLTERIELLKGKIQHLEHSVAYSTLTVHLNSPVPRTKKRLLPFEWVERLGDGLVRGAVARYSPHASRKRWIRFELPEGYIKYYEWPFVVWAMSARNVFVRIDRHENREGGGIGFWYPLIRRELVEEKAFAVAEEKEPLLDTLADAKMLVATKELGGKEYGYLVAVVANRKHVHVLEAWGPKEALDKDLPGLSGTT
jgi:hypothetical protein